MRRFCQLYPTVMTLDEKDSDFDEESEKFCQNFARLCARLRKGLKLIFQSEHSRVKDRNWYYFSSFFYAEHLYYFKIWTCEKSKKTGIEPTNRAFHIHVHVFIYTRRIRKPIWIIWEIPFSPLFCWIPFYPQSVFVVWNMWIKWFYTRNAWHLMAFLMRI